MGVREALEIVSLTDAGRVRSHNEDSVAHDADSGLAVLADGMGGHNAGEVASGIAVSLLPTEIRRRLGEVRPEARRGNGEDLGAALLREGVRKANASIYHAAQSHPQYAGMGTTVVAGLFYDNRVAVAHVGDSRMYRLRGGEFGAITRDHSLLQEQIDSGFFTPEEARRSGNRNLVTRAVGVEAEVEPEVRVHAVQRGDLYLLCSDGLNDMMEDEAIGEALRALRANLPLAARQLVEMANDNGGRDNVSVILVGVHGDFAAPRGWLAKSLAWIGA